MQDSFMIAGLDFGRTHARLALADQDATIVDMARTDTVGLRTPSRAIEWAKTEVERLAPPERRPKVAGIAAPGPLDPRRGVIVNAPDLAGWNEVPLAEMLSDALGCPAHLENDANLAGLGEFHCGAGQGSNNMVYVTWSTGVGAGLILNGRLFSGTTGAAGEIGHTIIDPNGVECSCGQRGCLEAFSGGGALERQTDRTAEDLFKAAVNGDQYAMADVGQAATYMGYALVNLTNLFDPQVIVIGGGITNSWDYVGPILTAALVSSPFIKESRRPRLCRAALGDGAGLVGAVEWARANL